MKGHRLFVRIFLWFLGAMSLMALVSVVLTVFMSQQGIILTGQQEVLSDALDRNGQKLLQILETEGTPDLSRKIETIRKDTGLAIFIFDGNGVPLKINDTPPSEYMERFGQEAYKLLAQGTTFQVRREMTSVYRRMISPSGKAYILAGVFRSHPTFTRVLTGNPKALFIHLLGLLATALIFCGLLARYLSDPLVRLNRTARSVADGHLDSPVDVSIQKRTDEIGELSRSFDAMKMHLTTLLEAQRRLICDISHELRTPLARLGVALELARKKSDAATSDSLNRIEHESAILNDMIGELLSLSRLEAEMGHIVFEKTDLLAMLDMIVEDANFEARAVNREVVLSAPEYLDPVKLNPELFRRAVENIIRNGLNYTPEGTSVEVAVDIRSRSGHAGIVIRVYDHGPGVPEKELDLIFKPFYRTETSRSRDTGGAGLGLAIAQKSVIAHGGEIHAELPPAGGFVVEMWLPR